MIHDFLIIGAGIAGASLATELAAVGKTIVLEAEDIPGYHATGRSAAFWSETYGGPSVQPLTSASHAFLTRPPGDFAEHSFLRKRGALHIANQDGYADLAAFTQEFGETNVPLEPLADFALARHCPGLRNQWDRAVWEPGCADIDVGGLHQSYLGVAKKLGCTVRCSSPVTALERQQDYWRAMANGEWIEARIVVNAAGAWADPVAEMAGIPRIGIHPYRRTIIQLRTDRAPESLPLIIDATGKFYFKGEGRGRIWLSPHDETPVEPGDVAPEEIDIARAIDRFEKVVDWEAIAVEKNWAGLRSFAPDRLPVYGFDPRAGGFFWCAGQGGFGIQTAPAAARMACALILNEAMSAELSAVNPDLYAPVRFI